MERQGPTQETDRGSASQFADTHWSMVLAAQKESSTPAAEAMEKLCRTYWRPIYAFVRREGHRPEEAEDLTQEFFARLLTKDYLQHLRHREGKFRSFLLTFLKHFLSDQRDRAGALKRGGGAQLIPLDELEEERGITGQQDALTPEQAFDRRWALDVMDRAAAQLRAEYGADGKGQLYELLKDLQPGERSNPGYAQIAARLGLTEAAIKSAVHRLRQRYRALLRAEIARTVDGEGEIDGEIRHLIEVLGT